jgi:histidine triad (HIT) family protein
VGLEVPHAHIHLIPINEIGDISFQKDKLQLSPTKMQEIANSISEAFSQL